MNSIAKVWALAVSLFISTVTVAQESQHLAAAKWENGEKACYGNWGSVELNLIENKEKVKIEIKYDSNNKVKSVYIDATNLSGSYECFGEASTDFVRYYGHYYTKKLFFTNNSIIIYESTETLDKTEVKVLGCVGKKINQKDVNNLISFLNSTKKYWVPINLDGISDKVTKVNVIPVYLDGNEELLPGEKFELEFEIELEWGVKLKSTGLNGNYQVLYFKIESNNITHERVKKKGNDVYSCVADCRYIRDNNMVIQGTIHNSTVKFSKTIPVNCDLDKSPGLVEARKWSQYSKILFNYTEKGEVKENSWSNDNGFLKYSDWFLWLLKNYKDDKTFLVRVGKDGKIGYADVNAKLVIPCEYEGGSAGNAMKDKIIAVKKDGKWGYIDLQNKLIVPFKYESIADFKNGMGKVNLGGKSGFVNSKGVEVVKPIYDKAWNFVNGAAIVMKDNKYGFVNESGAVLGGIIYDDAFNFDLNKFAVVKNEGKYGVIDLSGKLIGNIDQEKAPVSINADLVSISKNSLYGVINRAGKIVVDFKYQEIYPVGKNVLEDKIKRESEKIFRVRKDDQYGFIKTDGTVFSECIFFIAEDFIDGVAEVSTYDDGISKKGRFSLSTKNINWYEEIDYNKKDNDNASNSKGGNNSKGKATSDKKTIKNTGKGILHMGADGSTGYSVNGGGTVEFSCSKKVYYTFYQNGGYNGRGPVISEAKQDCGETINANGDQYNKK